MQSIRVTKKKSEVWHPAINIFVMVALMAYGFASKVQAFIIGKVKQEKVNYLLFRYSSLEHISSNSFLINSTEIQQKLYLKHRVISQSFFTHSAVFCVVSCV